MQLTAKLKNKSVPWAAILKPRVLDVVDSDGNYYVNITGYNGTVTDTNIWFPIGGSAGRPLVKTASDISGSDPFYTISLASDGLPAFPQLIKNITMFIDLAGDGADVEFISPVQYNATTKTIKGMNSPTDFPNQIIKIFVF